MTDRAARDRRQEAEKGNNVAAAQPQDGTLRDSSDAPQADARGRELAGCKINLGLRVLRRRNDGFHDIESALVPVPWFDIVTTCDAEAHVFTCSDPRLPTDERNLCVKARLAFEQHFGSTNPLRVHLEKRVPFGAGLGGGSSNAAAVLRVLARIEGIPIRDPDLHKLAAGIGSDVPFFLLGGPALAEGRGERLTPLSLDLKYHLVIATPDLEISTADAYAGVVPRDIDPGPGRSGDSMADIVSSGDIGRWHRELANDFEPFVFENFPQLHRLKSTLYAAGAGYAALTGTGSAIFGVFADETTALRAADCIIKMRVGGWIGDANGGYPIG